MSKFEFGTNDQQDFPEASDEFQESHGKDPEQRESSNSHRKDSSSRNPNSENPHITIQSSVSCQVIANGTLMSNNKKQNTNSLAENYADNIIFEVDQNNQPDQHRYILEYIDQGEPVDVQPSQERFHEEMKNSQTLRIDSREHKTSKEHSRIV